MHIIEQLPIDNLKSLILYVFKPSIYSRCHKDQSVQVNSWGPVHASSVAIYRKTPLVIRAATERCGIEIKAALLRDVAQRSGLSDYWVKEGFCYMLL